jgi:catechol 2,3-dioxygenase-like lactoylglutathione lyase family enzyme
MPASSWVRTRTTLSARCGLTRRSTRTSRMRGFARAAGRRLACFVGQTVAKRASRRRLAVSIRRIVPDITSNRMDESREFYVAFLGLEMAMNMGWIMTFASPTNPTAQVTVVRAKESSEPHPDITLEVSDVDTIHKRALDRSLPIVYPLTDEPWGVRRFFVRDPNGVVLNVMSHR